MSTIAGLAAIVLTSCGGSAGGGGSSGLVWGTSSVGSNYYNLAVAMGDVVARQTDVSTSVQAVGGSDATIRAIEGGHADLGMANSFAATNSYEGGRGFKQPVDLRIVAQGNRTLRQLVVRADSGIDTPADLDGKRIVGKRPALPGINLLTDAMLRAYGVDKNSVDVVSTADTTEAVNALQQGTVDGIVAPGGSGASIFKELARTVDVRWVDLSGRIDALLKHLGPAFVEGTIPAGTYKGQTEEIATPALKSLIVVDADLPNDAVYKTTKAIFQNNKDIANAVPNGEYFTAENTVASVPTVPFHPGAVRFLKEADMWTAKMRQAQQALLAP